MEMEGKLWPTYVYKTVADVPTHNNGIECGSICNSEGQGCHGFGYDESTCWLVDFEQTVQESGEEQVINNIYLKTG